MEKTKIQWATNTFNPWWGCTNVSPACDNCYAETFAKRHTRTKDDLWGKNSVRMISSDAYWEEPIRWNKRAAHTGVRERVFCGSMCDVMERRPDLDGPRQRLFKLIEATPNLDWLLLTKRPQEYSKFLPTTWLARPRPNVWLMTTCESQEYVWRIEELVRVPAVVHGVSIEPMLSKVALPDSFLKLGKAAWVICGGESGRGQTRPTPVEWFRDLREQCNIGHLSFFFKQWGNHVNLVKFGRDEEKHRLLDGRTWDEYPRPSYIEFSERMMYLASKHSPNETALGGDSGRAA